MSRKKKHQPNIQSKNPAKLQGNPIKPVAIAASISSSSASSMAYWFAAFALLVPIFFSSQTSDPVLPIRFIWLAAFCLFITGYLLWFKKYSPDFIQPRMARLVFLSGILFGIWSCFTVSNSINPSAGFFEISKHFLLLVFLVLSILVLQKEPAAALIICKGITLAAIAQSLVGILQYYDVAFADLPGANAKPFGLMANRNLLGSAQMLVLPFVLYIIYMGSRFWKITGIASAFLVIFSLVLSQTRSAWLGSAAIIIISFLLVLIFIRNNRKKWLLYYAIGIAGIMALAFLIISVDINGDLSKSVKERLNTITTTNASDTSNAAANTNERVKIWKKTIALIKDHPLRGVGTGNWKINIRDYGSRGTVWELGKTVPDRPHNVYLQITAETGIVGAILYFGMWLLVVLCGLLSLRKNGNDKINWLSILMLAGLGGFAVDCMFSFSTERIEHSIYIYLMAAFLIANYIAKNGTAIPVKQSKPDYLFVVPMMAVAAFCLFIGLKKYAFEKQLPIADAYEKANRNDEVLQAVEDGSSDFVTINESGKPLQVYSSLAYMNLKKYPEALKEGRKALQYNPKSAMVFNNIGAIYANMNKYDSASIYYRKALDLTPKFEETLKNIAGCYYNLKMYDSCIASLQKLNIGTDTYLTKLMADAKLLKAAGMNAVTVPK
jgi:O-antigen ligase